MPAFNQDSIATLLFPTENELPVPPTRSTTRHLTSTGVYSVSIQYHIKDIVYEMDILKSYSALIQDICLGHFKLNRYKTFCLRVSETDELLTEENFRKKLDKNLRLKLVPSPSALAYEWVEAIAECHDTSQIKKLMYSLSLAIKDPHYYQEFLKLEGLSHLVRVILETNGNTLAYALLALANLMESHQEGWDQFQPEFIGNMIDIIVQQNMMNIYRPATSIIIRFVQADKSARMHSAASSPNRYDTVRSTITAPIVNIHCYGFEVVYGQILKRPAFFPTLIQRISQKDCHVRLFSLDLINVLFRYAHSRARLDMLLALDSLNIRHVCVLVLDEAGHLDALDKDICQQLVEFQRILIKEAYKKKCKSVSLDRHESMLNILWESSSQRPSVGGAYKWRKLGFQSENMKREFERVGLLGLEMMTAFVKNNLELYQKWTSEPLNQDVDVSFPFGRAAIEVWDMLADSWEIQTGYPTAIIPNPLFFALHSVYTIALKLFYRLWDDMEGRTDCQEDDLARVSALVRYHYQQSSQPMHKDCHTKAFQGFEQRMLETPFHHIRQTYMAHLEKEDDIQNNPMVRHIREKVYRENYEFIKEQRIQCLEHGAWFIISKDKKWKKKWHRYYKLAPNHRYLHYMDWSEQDKPNTPLYEPSLKELTERVDLSVVSEVAWGDRSPTFSTKKTLTFQRSLCFSLLSLNSCSNQELDTFTESTLHLSDTLADFVCDSETRLSEWMDGFHLLLNKPNLTPQTLTLIDELTDMSLKLALLDFTGNQLDGLPMSKTAHLPEIPELPSQYDFIYHTHHLLELNEQTADLSAFVDESEHETLSESSQESDIE